ncbi:KRAB-A domain-containing protein 2-like [Melanaphis sacchari]|uniref:KRAB-A domain-containing protein 2-like n=1 Tax=Melanaphis sacchari TaxID=742174 RepID=UPI000DC1368E|nr:KRAB-A domain-containing protein 2-like [Melanaphis sacchari]
MAPLAPPAGALESKGKESKQRAVCKLLKRYDVVKIMFLNQLIVSLKPGETKIIYFVKNKDLFDIIHDAHIKTGHGERTRSLCVQCQRKQKVLRKGIVVKPIISHELNSRCQVDLVDMQTCKDGEYKFILNYQDHLTKFIQLRPLKSKTAEEVTLTLLPIFLTFGAPNILHSDNGREISNKIIMDLCSMWEGVKIVHSKPHHSQCQGSIKRANQDFQNILRAMMHDKITTKWSVALPFVHPCELGSAKPADID